ACPLVVRAQREQFALAVADEARVVGDERQIIEFVARSIAPLFGEQEIERMMISARRDVVINERVQPPVILFGVAGREGSIFCASKIFSSSAPKPARRLRFCNSASVSCGSFGRLSASSIRVCQSLNSACNSSPVA